MSVFERKSDYDPNLKIWSGEQVEFPFPSDVSLGSFLLKSLLKHSEKIAQICHNNGKQYTFNDIAQQTISISMHFKKLGFEQGDVVGFCGTNTDFVPALIIGALCNGLIVSTLDPSFEKTAIKHISAITKPQIMFCDKANYQRVAESLQELGLKSEIFTMDEPIETNPHISDFLMENTDLNGGDYSPMSLKVSNEKHPAFILCSSGTTGPPKGISVAHAGILHMISDRSNIPEVRTFTRSTLYWASGVLNLLYAASKGFTRIVTNEPFSAENTLDILEESQITITVSAPWIIAHLLASPTIHKRNLKSLVIYYILGAYLPGPLLKQIRAILPNTMFFAGYGLTELPGFGVTTGLANESGSTGTLNPNVQVKIINENGANLGPNESGEILVRSRFPFLGYYNNPEATAQNVDADGWIYTGDIGYMNDKGELFMVDRKKEIYKYLGKKYSANEIENVLMELPEVLDTCVCVTPDVQYTDIPAALIVLKPECTLSEQAVYDYVAQRLEDHKHLRGGVYFVKSIPMTPSGKHIRKECAKICEALRNKCND